MRINKVKIKNFLSIKDAKVDFDGFGSVVRITGRNTDTKPYSSNGAGKSSIIESIVFALFGKTIRKTNDKSLKNSYTKGRCSVELTVNNNINIRRVKKPPMLVVHVDGENVTQDSIQATQKYLEKILNTNNSVFLASMVFGQSNKINFLTSTADEKRAIIQSFLDVGDLFQYRKSIRSLKSKSYSGKKISETLCDDVLTKKKKLKERIEKLKKYKRESKKLISSDKSKLLSKFTLAEIQEMEQGRFSLEMAHETASHELNNIRVKMRNTRQRIKDFKPRKCEFCGIPPMKEAELLKEWKRHIKEGALLEMSAKNSIKEITKKMSGLGVPITPSDFELMENFKAFDTEHKILGAQSRDLNKLLKKNQKEVEAAQRNYDIMRFWELAFSEQGLIKYVIRNILDFFNDRVNYYLKFLCSSNFAITFDETLKEEIYNKGVLTYFDSLSGGEKRKLSLSVMLGLNDLLLLSGKERSNLIFFDEIADSLDERGVKGLYELISDISSSKKVFVITHNDYLNSLLEDESETLTVTKKDNITKIK